MTVRRMVAIGLDAREPRVMLLDPSDSARASLCGLSRTRDCSCQQISIHSYGLFCSYGIFRKSMSAARIFWL
jgi:hypothetical protein